MKIKEIGDFKIQPDFIFISKYPIVESIIICLHALQKFICGFQNFLLSQF